MGSLVFIIITGRSYGEERIRENCGCRSNWQTFFGYRRIAVWSATKFDWRHEEHTDADTNLYVKYELGEINEKGKKRRRLEGSLSYSVRNWKKSNDKIEEEAQGRYNLAYWCTTLASFSIGRPASFPSAWSQKSSFWGGRRGRSDWFRRVQDTPSLPRGNLYFGLREICWWQLQRVESRLAWQLLTRFVREYYDVSGTSGTKKSFGLASLMVRFWMKKSEGRKAKKQFFRDSYCHLHSHSTCVYLCPLESCSMISAVQLISFAWNLGTDNEMMDFVN